MSVPTAREFFFPSVPRTDAVEREYEQRFFNQLRLVNGTHKTTRANRMPDVDAAAAEALAPGCAVKLLDVAVSSGTTTVELIDALTLRGHDVTAVACDLTIRGAIHRIGPGLEVLVDADGNVLQVVTPLFVRGRPHDPDGAWQRRALMRFIKWCERRVRGTGNAVQLLSPRLVQRAGVTIVEHDLTVPRAEWVGRFGLVRAANILNLDYFGEPMLREMARHVASYLTADGVLVVCRTITDGSNHATVFQRQPDGSLRPISRIGAGSEVEALIVA